MAGKKCSFRKSGFKASPFCSVLWYHILFCLSIASCAAFFALIANNICKIPPSSLKFSLCFLMFFRCPPGEFSCDPDFLLILFSIFHKFNKIFLQKDSGLFFIAGSLFFNKKNLCLLIFLFFYFSTFFVFYVIFSTHIRLLFS